MYFPPPNKITPEASTELIPCRSASPVKLVYLAPGADRTYVFRVLDASNPDSEGALLIVGDCGCRRCLLTDGQDYWYGIFYNPGKLTIISTALLHPKEIESFSAAIEQCMV